MIKPEYLRKVKLGSAFNVGLLGGENVFKIERFARRVEMGLLQCLIWMTI